MTADDIFDAGLAASINRALGPEIFELRRSNTLEAKGTTPRALVASVPAAVGAASLTLAHADSTAKMKGTLLAGSLLRIAGADYTVQADASVDAAGDLTIPGVTIAPPLAAPLAAGGTVAITSGPRFTFLDGFVLDARRRDLGGDIGSELIMEVSLPTLGAPTTPRKGDSLKRLKDGTVGRITAIPSMVGGQWTVALGPQ